MCTSDASLCISNLEIVYDCILSDHHPIIGVINCNIIVESTDDCCDQETQLGISFIPMHLVLTKGRLRMGLTVYRYQMV